MSVGQVLSRYRCLVLLLLQLLLECLQVRDGKAGDLAGAHARLALLVL
jgi:hypothetical protein